jgi:hypothetical protein
VPKAFVFVGELLRGSKLSEEDVKALSEGMEAEEEELAEAQESLLVSAREQWRASNSCCSRAPSPQAYERIKRPYCGHWAL